MFKKTKEIIVLHWLIIIVAIIIGFIVVKPNLEAVSGIGFKEFKGIYPILTDDEEYYFSRTHEVLEGHRGLGNVFIKEHKDKPFMAPPLAESFFAGIAWLFHISIPTLFALCDFVLPFMGVVLLYALFYSMTASRKIALGSAVFFYLIFIREAGRAINQQFTFLFLFASLWLIWKIYISDFNRKTLKYHFWFSIMFSVLFYIYPHFWTPLLALYGISMLFKTIRNGQWKGFTQGAGVFLISFGLFGAYYFYNSFLAMKDLAYLETAKRMGLIDTHWPGAFYNTFPIVCAFILTVFARKMIINKTKLYFIYLVLGTGLLINWQNVITGKYVFFSIHYLQPSYLFVIIALGILLSELRFPKQENKKSIAGYIFAVFGSALIFSMLFYKSFDGVKLVFTLKTSPKHMLELQEQRKLFDWLNENTQKDAVVYFLGEGGFESNLPIYTDVNLYYGGLPTSFLISDSEIIDRWLRKNIFNDEINEAYLKDKNKTYALLANRFIDNYQNKMVRRKIVRFFTGYDLSEPEISPQWYTDMVVGKYREVKKVSVETALKKYEIDYILLDRKIKDGNKIEAKLKKEKFLEPIKEIDNVVIYKVN